MSDSFVTFSVVVPVHNSRRTIGKCLESLINNDHPSYEVVVVDDGSTDDTADICQSFDSVKVIRLSKGGPSRARNVGVGHSRGKYVAFTDGDCVVDRQWLSELEKGFTGEDIAGVGGDQKSPDDESETGRTVQEFMKTIGFITDYIKTGETLRETEHNPSCCAAYRRRVLDEVGGFDENLWPGEDVDLDRKIRLKGYGLVYNPAAVVAHYRPETYRGFARMMRRYGACQWPLVRRYGLFRKIHYEPVALIFLLLLAATLIWWDWRLRFALLSPLPVIVAWFLVKTASMRKAVLFSFLMLLTLVNWNWGFFTGHWYRPGGG